MRGLNPVVWKIRFSLMELWVVIAILAILISMLSPSLKKMVSASRDGWCLTKLRQLQVYAELYGGDHDDKIPMSSLEYNPSSAHSPGEKMPYNAEPSLVASEHVKWYSRGNIGQYVFEFEEPSNYAEHEVFACPSGTLNDNHEYPHGYFPNVQDDALGLAPWNGNWDLHTENYQFPLKAVDPEPRWTRFSDVIRPDSLFSIRDSAQNSFGRIPTSGAGGWSNYDDEYSLLWAGVVGSDPESLLLDKHGSVQAPPAQGDTPYTRGGPDYRHSDFSIQAVHVDGSAKSYGLGTVKNKNAKNRF